MDAPNLPGHAPGLAPGMSQVIEAGERYTITDDHGKELQLEGRDRPWTIEFLTAFDQYMEASAKLGPESPHTLRFGHEMRNTWLTMPDDLKKLMPSGRALGLRL